MFYIEGLVISPRQGRSENFTNIHTAMVGYTLNDGRIFTQPWWTINTQPWWDIHSTVVGNTLNYGGIYTQPWWDIHSTMVGHTLEDKSHINL